MPGKGTRCPPDGRGVHQGGSQPREVRHEACACAVVLALAVAMSVEATDPANGSITIAVAATVLDEPAGQRAAGSVATFRVGDGVPPPRKIHDVLPAYPSAARALRVQGLVILEATIGPTGEVVDVEVLRSVPELDAAAVAAVEQWRYEPTLVDGEAVPVAMTVTITFALPGDEAPRRIPPAPGEPALPAESPGSGGTALESAIFGQVLDAAGEPLPGTTIRAPDRRRGRW